MIFLVHFFAKTFEEIPKFFLINDSYFKLLLPDRINHLHTICYLSFVCDFPIHVENFENSQSSIEVAPTTPAAIQNFTSATSRQVWLKYHHEMERKIGPCYATAMPSGK